MIKSFYRLAKPGIVYGNALMYAAGFFLASVTQINWHVFFHALLGFSLVIAGACVFNNIADRTLDAKMPRTQKRALVTGKISIRAAFIYGLVLTMLGALVLYFFSTFLAFVSALIGFVVYVFLYTPLKPKTKYALFVGAVAGAMPPVVGYTAVTNTFDWWAFALFAALFVWQLPHFISIAVYRFEDYSLGGVPLFAWKPKSEQERKNAKRVFAASLVVLMVACLGIALYRIFTIAF